MSDWQVGDMALCVKMAGLLRNKEVAPGRIFKVEEVEFSEGSQGLILEGAHSRHWSKAHVATSFRKIRPDEREACEPEFVTLLQRIKRSVPA